MLDALVIGAGQAGLATARALQQAGLSFQLLEASDRTAGSWPAYYDSLTLFSPAQYSSLPDLPFPGNPERYPRRDEVINYLEQYASHFDFPIAVGSRVTAVQRVELGFTVQTTTPKQWLARTVIVASGPYQQPNIPQFPGLKDYAGHMLHSSAYRRPSDIHGTRVAVIGAGNSAVQIAYELAQTHEVLLTSRQPPRFMSQRPLGKDIHFWLKYSGLDTLPLGQWLQFKSTTPVLDHGLYRQAFQSGQIQYQPLFDDITPTGLRWGEHEQSFDTLLLATGFIHQPPYLQGLDGFDITAAAQHNGGVSRHIPGLYFVGSAWQRAHASATLRGVGADGRYVVHQLQRYLRSNRVGQPQLQGCC